MVHLPWVTILRLEILDIFNSLRFFNSFIWSVLKTYWFNVFNDSYLLLTILNGNAQIHTLSFFSWTIAGVTYLDSQPLISPTYLPFILNCMLLLPEVVNLIHSSGYENLLLRNLSTAYCVKSKLTNVT